MTEKLVRWGAFLLELCFLLMLFSATLLAPVPFGFARIGSIVLFAAVSFASAYFASFRLEVLRNFKGVSFKQVITKPPMVVWAIVVAIIFCLLASGLLTSYLSSRT